MQRREFSREFKVEAVRLVQGGETVAAAAKSLGISGQTLHNWVKANAAGQLREVAGKAVSAEQMEITRLKAELARMRMERDILKTYGPPRLQVVFSRALSDWSASTYPASGQAPGQDGDTRVPVLIKASASNAVFRTRLPEHRLTVSQAISQSTTRKLRRTFSNTSAERPVSYRQDCPLVGKCFSAPQHRP